MAGLLVSQPTRPAFCSSFRYRCDTETVTEPETERGTRKGHAVQWFGPRMGDTMYSIHKGPIIWRQTITEIRMWTVLTYICRYLNPTGQIKPVDNNLLHSESRPGKKIVTDDDRNSPIIMRDTQEREGAFIKNKTLNRNQWELIDDGISINLFIDMDQSRVPAMARTNTSRTGR